MNNKYCSKEEVQLAYRFRKGNDMDIAVTTIPMVEYSKLLKTTLKLYEILETAVDALRALEKDCLSRDAKTSIQSVSGQVRAIPDDPKLVPLVSTNDPEWIQAQFQAEGKHYNAIHPLISKHNKPEGGYAE